MARLRRIRLSLQFGIQADETAARTADDPAYAAVGRPERPPQLYGMRFPPGAWGIAERADDCGALWAVRMLYRLASAGMALPPTWPGTKTEARGLVDTFADRVGFTDREKLTVILQYAAELMWTESLERIRSAPASFPALERRPFSSSISSHFEKLSPS